MFEVFMIVFACVATVDGPDCYQINEYRYHTMKECDTNIVPEVQRLYRVNDADTEAQFMAVCVELLEDV